MNMSLGTSFDPFRRGDPRAAQRQLHLKPEPLTNNSKKPNKRKQGSFGDIVDAVIVDEGQQENSQSVDPRYSQNDAWVMAAQARVRESQTRTQIPQEQIDNLSAEVKSLRADLNNLMAKQSTPQPGATNLRGANPGQINSFNKNLGFGYELGNA